MKINTRQAFVKTFMQRFKDLLRWRGKKTWTSIATSRRKKAIIKNDELIHLPIKGLKMNGTQAN